MFGSNSNSESESYKDLAVKTLVRDLGVSESVARNISDDDMDTLNGYMFRKILASQYVYTLTALASKIIAMGGGVTPKIADDLRAEADRLDRELNGADDAIASFAIEMNDRYGDS